MIFKYIILLLDICIYLHFESDVICMKRRTLIGGAGLVGIAGCFALVGSDTETDSADDSGDSSSDGSSSEEQQEASDEELQEEAEQEAEEEQEQADESSDGGDSSGDEETPEGTITVEVDYSGSWSGSVGDDESQRSVDGSGTEEFEVNPDSMVVSGTFQKDDDSSDELTVRIKQDGEVVNEQSTTAEYGVVSVSESFF